MPLSFSDELSAYIVTAVQTLAGQVRALNQAETPFTDGVLSPSGGGTGVANSNSNTLTLSSSGTLDLNAHTLTLSSNSTLDLGGATLSLPVSIANGGTAATTAANARSNLGTNDAANITTGTLSAARLGASPTASTVLHGDSTWSAVSLTAEVSGALPVANGGTGATTAASARTNLATNDAANITTGTLAAARLGATPTATKLLFGDSTWNTLAASDIPSLAASIITSGSMATARLGSGTASSSTFLRGDSTWAAPGGPTGSGSNTQVAYWTGSSTLSGDAGMIYNSSTNTLTMSGNVDVSSSSKYLISGNTALGMSGGNVLQVGNDSTFTLLSLFASGGSRVQISSTGLAVGGSPGHFLHLVGSDDAAKTTTTLWTTTSDARTKEQIETYTRGLDFLKLLPPVRTFLYNGRFGSDAGMRGVNFVAQEIEPVAPGWIRRRMEKEHADDPDGSEVEILKLNNHELTFALLNAVLDLDKRMTTHGL